MVTKFEAFPFCRVHFKSYCVLVEPQWRMLIYCIFQH